MTESDSTSGQFADDAYLTGAYATLDQLPSGSLDLYALYNKDGAKDTDQGTMGARFRTAQKGDLESSHLGEEVDLTLTYKYRPGFTIVAGLSRVIADDSMTSVTRYKDSIEDWNGDMTFTYLMTNTTF